MVWIIYILGCAQTIYINASPKENSYFHEKVAIDKSEYGATEESWIHFNQEWMWVHQKTNISVFYLENTN